MKKLLTAIASALVLVGASEAALVDRGGGLVYDTSLNVTWLADWSYAVTSGYAIQNSGGLGSFVISADGSMGWDAAQQWANSLVIGGAGGWRLPKSGGCSGFSCTTGELGHLFYEDLGGRPNESVLVADHDTFTQIANLTLFENVGPKAFWLEEYAPQSPGAWFFTTGAGLQSVIGKSPGLHVMLVHSGDVSLVPEPASYALFIAGLLCVLVELSRRQSGAPR